MSNKINTVQISGTSYSIEDSGATRVLNVTQAEYDALVTGGTVDPTVLYNITDATSVDISQYWTSAQTNSAITQAVSGKADTTAVTESITQAVSGKQDTLSAGTGIDITNNVISATGGGGGTIDPSLDSGSTNAVANSAITNGFNAYVLNKNSDNGEVKYFYTPSPSRPYGGDALIKNFSINGRCPLTQSNGTNSYIDKFSLVETSAITTTITSASTDTQVPSAKAVYDQLGGLKLVKLTQSAYDALSPNYDNNTLYVIVN